MSRAIRAIGPRRLALELRRGRGSLLVILAGALTSLAVGVVVLQKLDVSWPWTSKLAFDVEVANASGVSPGRTSVTVAGVEAGRVTGVRLRADTAILHVELDPDYGPVRRDARLRLRPKTQLQDMVLDITDRGRGAPLRPGETISASQTQTAVPVGAVLDTFAPPTRDRLTTMLRQLGAGLDDRGAELRRTFVTLVPFLRASSRMAEEVARRDRLARRLVHDSTLLFEELARRDRELAGLVADGGTTLKAIGGQRAALAAALEELAPTVIALRRASADLTTGLARTGPALRALRSPVGRLPGALAALDRLGARARPVLAALRPAIGALTPAVARLAPAARSIRLAAARLDPQIPRVDRVADDVAACRYQLNKFFQNTLSFYKYGGPYGPIGRSELVYGSAQALGRWSPSEEVGPMCYDAPNRGGR